jgi:hypothetical protein
MAQAHGATAQGIPATTMAAKCTVASAQAFAPADTTITGAMFVAATQTVPEYCRVEGYVAKLAQ